MHLVAFIIRTIVCIVTYIMLNICTKFIVAKHFTAPIDEATKTRLDILTYV